MKNTITTTLEGKKPEIMLAVVLVRGLARVRAPVVDTLRMLKLTSKNQCVLIKDTPVYRGMLHKVKDYVTYGEITELVLKELVKKRARPYEESEMDRKKLYHYKVLEFNGKKYWPYFNLSPPLRGFGRKGIKISFKVGGSLGYRGEKINDLLTRMM